MNSIRKRTSMNAHGQVVRAAALLQVFVLIAYFIPSSAYAITCGAGTDIGGGQCRVFLTSGTSWTVPGDWNNSSNKIEAIGAGGGGSNGNSNNGGGGGAYAAAVNQSLTAGATITYAIGTGGSGAATTSGTTALGGTSGGDTYFCNSSSNCGSLSGTAVVAGAQGGQGGPATGNVGGAGGAAASSVGSTKYSGGNGGTYGSTAYMGGSGGGGAAGPSGAGTNGSNTSSTNNGANGGTGDAGAGGSGGAGSTGASTYGGVGGAGTEWDASHGSGGGGGGGYGAFSGSATGGGNGGAYGAGGGSGATLYNTTETAGGSGAQGLVVITYTPLSYYAPTVVTLSAQSFTPTTATVYGQVSNPNAQGGATTVGFAYSTDSTLTTGVSTTTISGTFGYGAVFSSSLTGLSANQVYYYRAYATNAVTTGFGSILSFGTGTATPVRKVVIYSGTTIKIRSGSTIKIRQQ